MSTLPTDFNRGVVRPVECIQEGWQLVKQDYWLMLGICFVGMLVGSVGPFGILMGPMMCGVHLCMFSLARGEKPEFNLLFKGFDHFVPSLIATLIQFVPMLVVIVPVYIAFFALGIGLGASAGANNGEPPPAMFAVFALASVVIVFVIVVASILIGLSFIFAYQLIIERGLSGVDACKVSARAVWANFGGSLGLVLLLALMGFAGVLACYVGAILLIPVHFAAIDVAYRRVFPAAAVPASPYAPPPQYPNYGDRFPGQ